MKNSRERSSFAAPMHTPNTSECRVNLGMQVLHMGQWTDLNAFGISQALHIMPGFSRYGLTYNIFLASFLFDLVSNLPLDLKATSAYRASGIMNSGKITLRSRLSAGSFYYLLSGFEMMPVIIL